MKFLVFSDIHFDKNRSKSYTMENGMSSWTQHQIDVIDQIFTYAIKNNIEHVFFGGDLFELKNRIPQDLYNQTWSQFEYGKQWGLDIILNTGNHDFHSKVSSSLKPFSSIVAVITQPTDFEFGDTLIRVIPFGQVSGSLKRPDAKTCILFTHEDISGLSYGKHEYISSSRYKKQLFSDFDLVFNGHIHKAQKLGNIINVGSCMRQDFGETDKKYFYHYEDGEVKDIEIQCPEFHIIDKLSDELREQFNNRDFYRIDIESSELSDPIFKQFNVFPNIIRTKKKKERLVKQETIEEEINKYIEITETELNKDKLIKIGKGLLI